MKKTGFTLIEILVVVGILGIIAAISTNMFFSVLQASTKTRVLSEVKQNGDYALNVMERTIRNAKSVTSNGNSITIVNPDDSSTTFSCSNGNLTLDGASLISNKVEVQDCSVFSVVPGEEGVSPAVVTIDFTLSQAGTAARPEEQAAIDFGITVTLRNY